MISSLRELHQRHRHSLRSLLRFALYLLAFFLICMTYWVGDNFGEPPLEQVLYHIQFGMEGLVDTDAELIKSFINIAIILPVSSALLLVVLETAIGLFLTHGSKHRLAKMVSVANLNLLKGVYWAIGHRAPVYSFIIAMAYFGAQFSILAFLHNQFGKDYFAENYVYPAKVAISPIKPKNLVLIYIESLEDSYQNPKVFGKNLLQSLDKLGGISFQNYRQAPGTGWTIAGITSTQCALPLKSVSLYDGNGIGENIKTFLPNAVCLGDVLHGFGYHNVYMGSDALAFSGKGKFFQDHHYDEVYGKDELRDQLTDAEMNDWGLYDDDLLVKVKAKLIELHDAQRPFNLTITTIDTHGPDGFFSKRCKQDGAKDFAGVVECTSNQVAEFVQFIKKSGYIKNTNVVILGDHLAMYNPVYDKLDKLPARHVYNRMISRTPLTKNRDNVLHFDMFPTILEFMGFKVQGGRLGLGFNAISKDAAAPSPNEFEEMNEDLLNQSDEYLDLWKPQEPPTQQDIPKTDTLH